MRQIGIDELRKIQLEILDVVMKFCEEHDILCFLDGGTLLGAVRHKGYIPWDDDIDVGMLRPDYNKFMKLFNENNTRYKFWSLENDPECIQPFGKVFDTSTEYYEPDRRTGNKSAVNIDIWPMDNAPDDDRALKKMFCRQYILRNLHAGRFLPMFAHPNGNIFRKIVAYSVRIPMNLIPVSVIPKNYFARKILKNAMIYSSVSTRRVGSFMGFHELAMDRAKFEKFTYAEFEGGKYKIPSGYDEWLTKLYGDYMKLPPESKRKTHHHFEAFVKEDGD
ncbi:MAG: LicD family protein [Synergistaceae bacterium]|nr:LicD family protein [Synergistaceae bacterium]